MVWGAIGATDKISCHTFKFNMDAPFYIKILQNHLLPAARQQNGDSGRTMIQNIEVKLSKNFWIVKYQKAIDWVPNSLNLNPMENMWSILKRLVENWKPSNIDDWKTFIHEEWQKVDIHIVNNLIGSMKTRCLMIIDSGDERISYWFVYFCSLVCFLIVQIRFVLTSP